MERKADTLLTLCEELVTATLTANLVSSPSFLLPKIPYFPSARYERNFFAAMQPTPYDKPPISLLVRHTRSRQHVDDRKSFLPYEHSNKIRSPPIMSKREFVAWILLLLERSILLLNHWKCWPWMTTHINTTKTKIEFQHVITPPTKLQWFTLKMQAELFSRMWHSNSHPSINKDMTKGSCWSSADEWYMCTVSLATNTIITSGDTHFTLVNRKDVGE